MPEYSITFFKTTFRPTKGGRLNTIRARDFIPSFPSMVRSSRTKKNHRETLDLYGITHQMHLTDIDRT